MPVGGFFSNGGYSGSTGGSRSPGGGSGGGGSSSGNSWSMPEWSSPQQQPSPNPSPLQPGHQPFKLGGADPSQYPDLYKVFQVQQQQSEQDRSYQLANQIVNAQTGPQDLMLEDTLARQQLQLGMTETNVEYQKMAARRDADLARRKLELERGLANGQLGNIEKLRALAGEQLANQKADFEQQRVKAKDSAGRNQWDLRSQLTSRGAFSTIANERGTGRINRDLAYSLSAIDNATNAADIAYRQGQVGYDNQALQLRNRLAGIGLDAEGVANALESGLEQIGLGGLMSINQLLDAMNGTHSQRAALAGQVVQQAAALAGLPPGTLETILSSAGMGGGGGSAYLGGTGTGTKARQRVGGAPL